MPGVERSSCFLPFCFTVTWFAPVEADNRDGASQLALVLSENRESRFVPAEDEITLRAMELGGADRNGFVPFLDQ